MNDLDSTIAVPNGQRKEKRSALEELALFRFGGAKTSQALRLPIEPKKFIVRFAAYKPAIRRNHQCADPRRPFPGLGSWFANGGR